MKFADLHVHTTASDGSDTLKRRVRDAKAKGLSCIAVTDHDTFHPELEEPVSEIRGLEVISGAELEVVVEDIKIELLCYFVDRNDEEIADYVEKTYSERIERMKEMVSRVNELIDSLITFEEVQELAGTTVARPHLAKKLVQKNEAESISDAFSKYISRDSYAYVPLEKTSSENVINMVHNCGGVVSLAHPGRNIPKDRFENVLGTLQDQGLDAIEANYFYDRFKNSDKKMYFGNKLSKEMAKKYGFLITGGSDCHGSTSGFFTLGKSRVEYGRVKELKERRKRYL